MANTVYETTEIELSDGTEVTLKPLNIARLRRFMAAWDGMKDVEPGSNESLDVFLNCAGIGLEDELSKVEALQGRFTTTKGKNGKVLDPKYQEYLEDVLDLDTIFLVLKVTGGLDLQDPKLVQAAINALTETKDEAGTM